MRKLIRHELDFVKSLEYFKNNLYNLNILSNELINTINFTDGCFFTLLLDNSNLSRLYEFEAGLILPQNPEMQYMLAETTATYSITPTIQKEIAHFLFQEIKLYKVSCIFDDYTESPNSFLLQQGDLKDYFFIHNKEVYYLVCDKKANFECLIKCIKRSNAIWHSLCVLTTQDCENHKEISLDQIRKICLHTQLIMLGAYDGEAYIFWERS